MGTVRFDQAAQFSSSTTMPYILLVPPRVLHHGPNSGALCHHHQTVFSRTIVLGHVTLPCRTTPLGMSRYCLRVRNDIILLQFLLGWLLCRLKLDRSPHLPLAPQRWISARDQGPAQGTEPTAANQFHSDPPQSNKPNFRRWACQEQGGCNSLNKCLHCPWAA